MINTNRRKNKMTTAKYLDALKPNIEFINNEIEKSPDGFVRVRIKDIANAMNMTEQQLISIYKDFKYTLFQEGIFVTTGKTRADEPIFAMRKKMEGDTLQRINFNKFKNITLSSKDDFWEFIGELPGDLKCSELAEIFDFENFVEKIYFDSGSCEPYAAKQPELYIKLKTSAKIPDVIKIFEKMKPDELDYDAKTNTINLWFD
jgi:hypothetical protein